MVECQTDCEFEPMFLNKGAMLVLTPRCLAYTIEDSNPDITEKLLTMMLNCKTIFCKH